MKQQELNDLCVFIISRASDVIRIGEAKEKNFVFSTCLSLCKRIKTNIEAINILLPVYFQNKSMELSIGILLRCNLLDSLILTYLVYRKELLRTQYERKEINADEYFSSLVEVCKQIQFDQLKHTEKSIKTQIDLGIKTQNQWDSIIKNIADKYNIPEDWKGLKPFLGPSEILKKLYTDKHYREGAFRTFDLYTIYSKYDHFGFLSDEMLSMENDLGNFKVAMILSLLSVRDTAIFIGGQEIAKEIEEKIKKLQ